MLYLQTALTTTINKFTDPPSEKMKNLVFPEFSRTVFAYYNCEARKKQYYSLHKLTCKGCDRKARYQPRKDHQKTFQKSRLGNRQFNMKISTKT